MYKSKPEVRVIVRLSDEGMKSFYSVVNVSTTIAFGGVGQATVVLNDKDSKIFKKDKKVTFDKKYVAPDEMNVWKDFLERHKQDNWLKSVKDKIHDDYYFEQTHPFEPVDLIWIDSRGRDGHWYSIFTGVIVGIHDSNPVGVSRSVTLMANNFLYFSQYYPAITGLNNIGKLKDIETELTASQKSADYMENIFQGKGVDFIFNALISLVNENIHMGDNPLFDTDIWINAKNAENDFDSFYNNAEQNNINHQIIKRPDAKDATEDVYYTQNALAYAYIQKHFNTYEIYKRLIRSKFELFNITYEQISAILERIVTSTLSDYYVDPLGNLRIELPNINSCPNTTNKFFHGGNYIITRKDISYINADFSFDSGKIVTFTQVPFSWLSPVADLSGGYLEKLPFGRSRGSTSDFQKFGLREFITTPIFSNQLPQEFVTNNKEMADAVAEAVRLKVNQRANSVSYILNQRPDLELNKTMLNADRGRIHLITSISHQIVPGKSHTTTISCEYDRKVGELVPDPWKLFEELKITSNDSIMNFEGDVIS